MIGIEAVELIEELEFVFILGEVDGGEHPERCGEGSFDLNIGRSTLN